MIGFYNYTVVLTYFSLLSATTGIVISLANGGHPYYGCYFLLFCGLCDAFDGKVARTKKERTVAEMDFGVQIDSLSDIVAFGVLPACIGASLIRVSPSLCLLFENAENIRFMNFVKFILHAVLVLYVLAAMIRLAYFNVSEHERQEHEGGERKYYQGLPVTSAALVFPLVLLLQFILPQDITIVYMITAVLLGVLFLCKFRLKKPGLRGILIMVAIGAVEFLLMAIWKTITNR